MRKDTARLIKDTFIELYTETYFDKISVKDICQRANISRATFYTYYEDLESLLREIEETLLYDISELLESWRYVSLKNFDYSKPFPMIMKINYYVSKHVRIYRALFGKYSNHGFVLKYNTMVKQSFYQKWLEEGYDDEKAQIMASMAAGCIIHVNVAWIMGDIRMTPEEIALMTSKSIGAMSRLDTLR